jgi:hypothetical protein
MSDVFVYKTTDGEIKIPSFDHIPGRLMRRHRRREELDFVYSILEDLLDEAELDKLDALDRAQQEDLFTKWQKAGKSTFPQS